MKKIFSRGCILFLLLLAFLPFPAALQAQQFSIDESKSFPESMPWDLKGLSEAPQYNWSKDTGIKSLYFRGQPYREKATRVFAYYATPGSIAGSVSDDKNLPAVVLVHGGGGTAFAEWAKLWASRGYAAIAIDLAGCGPERMPLEDGGPGQGHDQKFGKIDRPLSEQWTYHAVANVISAHSLLLSMPEVDPHRTAIIGISWGGYLTCIAAGLDNRFQAAVPVYGCGFLHENSVWLNEFAKMTPENKAKWVRLWDPSQYVGFAQMPMLFINGGNDAAYYPISHAKTYATVSAEKNLHFVPNLPHGHIFDRPQAVEVFIDSHLKNGLPLAKIVDVEVKKQIVGQVASPTPLKNAQLHYSLDALPGDEKTRRWISQSASLEGNQITAPLPPEDTSVWFLTVSDQRGTTVSSPLVFP